MSEMVERVARAICLDRAEPWDDMNRSEQASWAETARAAIEAMREPTPEMLGLLVSGEPRPFYPEHMAEFYGSGRSLAENWSLAIDSALSPESNEAA